MNSILTIDHMGDFIRPHQNGQATLCRRLGREFAARRREIASSRFRCGGDAPPTAASSRTTTEPTMRLISPIPDGRTTLPDGHELPDHFLRTRSLRCFSWDHAKETSPRSERP